MLNPLFSRAKLKKYLPGKIKHRLRQISETLNIGRLPLHPYPEQFTPEMDCPERDWADRFVMIASTPRCGSHYLGHMLGETGECGVPLEYLNQGNMRYWKRRFKTNDFGALFEKFVQHRTSPNGTFTLKAHWNQYGPHVSSADEVTRGIGFRKIIWISRRNQLSQAISTVIAQQTGVWIFGATPTAEATFDYDAIVRSADFIRSSNLHWRDYVSALPPECSMVVVYEDMLSDDTVRENIQKFLDLKTMLKPSDRTRKQGADLNADWKKRFTDQVQDKDRWILEAPEWFV